MEMLLKIIDGILGIFGLCRKKVIVKYYENRISMLNEEIARCLSEDKDRYNGLYHVYEALLAEHDEQREEIEKLTAHIASVTFQTLESYQKINSELERENKEILAGKTEAMEFYKKIQEQLSEIYHNSDKFKFPRSMPIPGSTVVVTTTEESDESDDRFVVVKGRSILPDDITTKIEKANSMKDAMQIVITHLTSAGIITRIGHELMTSGAVELAVAYNKNCTAKEVYFRCKTKRPETNDTITY